MVPWGWCLSSRKALFGEVDAPMTGLTFGPPP